ncbi:MAG: hypothetical protein KDD66_16290 [Bdellovibrionales bacterium]|nr:hypothetical protein [Bdellovibrionales bacterium]
MAIEPISAVAGNAPVLVIDRVQTLGRPTIRVAYAEEVLGQRALEPSTDPEPAIPAEPQLSEELLAATVRPDDITPAFLESAPVPPSFTAQRPYYDRLVLFGSFYIDVIV